MRPDQISDMDHGSAVDHRQIVCKRTAESTSTRGTTTKQIAASIVRCASETSVGVRAKACGCDQNSVKMIALESRLHIESICHYFEGTRRYRMKLTSSIIVVGARAKTTKAGAALVVLVVVGAEATKPAEGHLDYNCTVSMRFSQNDETVMIEMTFRSPMGEK